MKTWISLLSLAVCSVTAWGQGTYIPPSAPAVAVPHPAPAPQPHPVPQPAPVLGALAGGCSGPHSIASPSYHCSVDAYGEQPCGCWNCSPRMSLLDRCRSLFSGFSLRSSCHRQPCPYGYNEGCPAPCPTRCSTGRASLTSRLPRLGGRSGGSSNAGCGSDCSQASRCRRSGFPRLRSWLSWRPAKTSCCGCCGGARQPSFYHYFRDYPCIEGCQSTCGNNLHGGCGCNSCQTGHALYAQPTGHGCGLPR